MKILVCNAGSSTLKFSLFGAGDEVLLAGGAIDWSAEPTELVLHCRGQREIREKVQLQAHADAIERILVALQTGPAAPLRALEEIAAVGHRVVHGGARFTAAVRITPEVKKVIAELAGLAPLHNPPSLDGILAAEQALPGVPQVAAFDTAFHATLPPAARTYPVPRKWTREWGMRRFGFHGLSHAYCSRRAAELLGRRDLRLVIAHLGNGASVAAVRDGACVDTSMGFTPLEGLMMGTRSGTIDPGMLLHLLKRRMLAADEIDRALNFESGLLGVSGISSDMRRVLSEVGANPDARLAVDVYVHRIRQTVGAMAAVLGGIDALVFTAGVGENAPEIRRRTCENLDCLGLQLDLEANETSKPDADVSAAASAARILVIATNEDLTIARETRHLLETSLIEQPGGGARSPARPLRRGRN